MSQTFVVSVGVQHYKCMCLFYLLWCIYLMFERHIFFMLVGVFVAIYFSIPIHNDIHLYESTLTLLILCFLSFYLFVLPSISPSVFLSFHLSVFLSQCIQCSKKAQMTRNGFQKPKICIATPKMENGRKFLKFVNIRN